MKRLRCDQIEPNSGLRCTLKAPHYNSPHRHLSRDGAEYHGWSWPEGTFNEGILASIQRMLTGNDKPTVERYMERHVRELAKELPEEERHYVVERVCGALRQGRVQVSTILSTSHLHDWRPPVNDEE